MRKNADKDAKQKASKSFGCKILSRELGTTTELTVGCCDGVTFGVDELGRPFHTGAVQWSVEDTVRWADANAVFFQSLSNRLARFRDAVIKHKGAN